MRKLFLAATAVGALAIPANASTIVNGTYTVTFSDSNTTASVTDNLTNPGTFSLTAGAARSGLLTVNPGICFLSPCNPDTATVTVTFNNLTVNGHNFGGFSENGVYTAYYGAQTDTVVWNGAVDHGLSSPFGTAQDGTDAFVFTDTLDGGSFGTLAINMIDGSDWNVATYVEAGFTAAPVPGPIVGAGLPGLVAACFGLLGLREHRRRRTVA